MSCRLGVITLAVSQSWINNLCTFAPVLIRMSERPKRRWRQEGHAKALRSSWTGWATRRRKKGQVHIDVNIYVPLLSRRAGRHTGQKGYQAKGGLADVIIRADKWHSEALQTSTARRLDFRNTMVHGAAGNLESLGISGQAQISL
jgi:hypothetical protein